MHKIPTDNQIFSDQPVCPICGESRRTLVAAVSHGAPFRWLSRYYRITESHFAQKMVSYRCDNCDTIYNDPYFTLPFRANLFQNVHPQHGAGWQRFLRWHTKGAQNDSGTCDKAAFEIAKRLCGDVDVYAELNCPFMGLLMTFAPDDVQSAAERHVRLARNRRSINFPVSVFNYERRKSLYRRLPKSMPFRRLKSLDRRLSLALKGLLTSIIIGAAWCRGTLNASLHHRAPIPDGYALPATRYLISEPSSIFWGANCSSEKVSCQGVAAALLDAQTISLREMKIAGIKPDIVGAFDVVDHVDQPTSLILSLLDDCRVLLIRTHHQEEKSSQHLFGFSTKFLDFLKTTGISGIDLTKQVKSKNAYYLLLTKDADISAELSAIQPNPEPEQVNV